MARNTSMGHTGSKNGSRQNDLKLSNRLLSFHFSNSFNSITTELMHQNAGEIPSIIKNMKLAKNEKRQLLQQTSTILSHISKLSW